MSKSLELTPVQTVACCSPLTSEPLSAEQAERIAPLVKALADPVRLRLLSLVASHADGEACVCDLNDAFDLSQPTISHHLKVLHDVGPPGPGEAGRVGVLPHQRRRAARLRCAARRRRRMTDRMRGRIEDTPRMPLVRRAVAELVGTAFLVAAVIGSGIAATRLSPDDVGLQLLENSLVTGAALVALILALQPVSASFNPVVTLVERALGLVTTRVALALVPAQVVGACLGALVANLMFDLDAVSVATHVRTGAGLWLGEVVATLGLVLVVFGSLRSARVETVAFAVGGYIAAAYWFTSSTSFANPAVTVARMFSDTLRRHRARLGRHVRPHAARRRRTRPRARPAAVPHPRARMTDSHGPGRPTVLFVCVHNAAARRWPPATSSTRGGRIRVLSAGRNPPTRSTRSRSRRWPRRASTSPRPRPRCSPRGRAGLRRGGHDGLRRRLPVLPRHPLRGLELDDPAGQGIEAVRPIRDEIRARVEALVAAAAAVATDVRRVRAAAAGVAG